MTFRTTKTANAPASDITEAFFIHPTLQELVRDNAPASDITEAFYISPTSQELNDDDSDIAPRRVASAEKTAFPE